jgi:DNA-binding protein YbaB
MVCGQTAHLHPGDIAKLRIPESLIDSSADWAKLADMLRIEAALNDQLNDIAHQQQEMHAILGDSK